MKYVKGCLIITMLFGVGYACGHGDLNYDEQYNVLDIVLLAVCVLGDYCEEYSSLIDIQNYCWIADMNDDGGFNVLDIVILANCVLANSCDDL